MKSGHHWLLYVGPVVFFCAVVPMILIDMLGKKIDQGLGSRREPHRQTPRGAESLRPAVFHP
ncbi:hypothetical protein ABZ281_26845 [Streptomyces sp. NPDC006265]|uniref:hypothetical protein n=1 Tax=Streptomyces sp. NPDC006265 TaxID=3156740 RepID=UPI0033B0BB25